MRDQLIIAAMKMKLSLLLFSFTRIEPLPESLAEQPATRRRQTEELVRDKTLHSISSHSKSVKSVSELLSTHFPFLLIISPADLNVL